MSKYTRGGQKQFLDIRMMVQVFYSSFKYAALGGLLLMSCLMYFKTEMYLIRGAVDYWKAGLCVLSPITPADKIISYKVTDSKTGEIYTNKAPADSIYYSPHYRAMMKKFYNDVLWSAFISYIFAFSLLAIWMYHLGRVGKELKEEKYIRGVRFEKNPNLVNKELKKLKLLSPYKIGDLHLVKDKETRHIGLIGTTGVGKTTVIQHLSNQNEEQNKIYIDPDGAFIEKNYDPTKDIILNPADKRHAGWCIFEEIETYEDYDDIASAIIPDAAASADPFWTSTPRTLFAATLRKICEDEDSPKTYEHLIKVISSIPLEQLEQFLKETEAANMIDGRIDKTAQSIRMILMDNMKSFKYLVNTERNKKFSFKQFIYDLNLGNKTYRNIFISYKHGQLESFRPLLTLWITLFTSKTKSLGRREGRRIWLFIDELAKLNKINQLSDTLSVARNYGLCLVLGYQNNAQLKDIYGNDTAQAIIDLLSTKLYFRNPSEAMAELSSRDIGTQEVMKPQENFSAGSSQSRDAVTFNQQITPKRIVTAGEIQGLSDLKAYVIQPIDVPRTLIELRHAKSKPRYMSKFLYGWYYKLLQLYWWFFPGRHHEYVDMVKNSQPAFLENGKSKVLFNKYFPEEEIINIKHKDSEKNDSTESSSAKPTTYDNSTESSSAKPTTYDNSTESSSAKPTTYDNSTESSSTKPTTDDGSTDVDDKTIADQDTDTNTQNSDGEEYPDQVSADELEVLMEEDKAKDNEEKQQKKENDRSSKVFQQQENEVPVHDNREPGGLM